jgi:TfoX/Sxy family transcriptional regulator of competence genes
MRGEDDLAARVRACLAGVEGVTELKMFGGVGFMLNGNMLAGTSKRGLLLRVGKERHGEAVAEPGMRAMEQRSRVMEGYVYADPPPALDAALKAWLERALDHVRTLPPKTGKTKGKPPTRVGRGR